MKHRNIFLVILAFGIIFAFRHFSFHDSSTSSEEVQEYSEPSLGTPQKPAEKPDSKTKEEPRKSDSDEPEMTA